MGNVQQPLLLIFQTVFAFLTYPAYYFNCNTLYISAQYVHLATPIAIRGTTDSGDEHSFISLVLFITRRVGIGCAASPWNSSTLFWQYLASLLITDQLITDQ